MLSIADVTTNLNICKILAVALPRFYKRTKKSAQFTFVYNPKSEGMEISLGFAPTEATEVEYNILFEEIIDAEKLIFSEQVLHSAITYNTIEQIIFKHREDMRQIIEKQKKND